MTLHLCHRVRRDAAKVHPLVNVRVRAFWTPRLWRVEGRLGYLDGFRECVHGALCHVRGLLHQTIAISAPGVLPLRHPQAAVHGDAAGIADGSTPGWRRR